MGEFPTVARFLPLVVTSLAPVTQTPLVCNGP
jgi:hypothetical protein